jgi:hypothetical protein
MLDDGVRGDEEGVGLAEEFVEVVGVGVKGHITSGTRVVYAGMVGRSDSVTFLVGLPLSSFLPLTFSSLLTYLKGEIAMDPK